MRNLAVVLVLVLMVSFLFANRPRINNSQSGLVPEVIPSKIECRLVKREVPGEQTNLFNKKGYELVYLCESPLTKDGETPERGQLDPGRNQIENQSRSFYLN